MLYLQVKMVNTTCKNIITANRRRVCWMHNIVFGHLNKIVNQKMIQTKKNKKIETKSNHTVDTIFRVLYIKKMQFLLILQKKKI